MKQVIQTIKGFYQWVSNVLEKYLPIISILSFCAGIALTSFWAAFGDTVQNSMDSFIEGYGALAPGAIFLILAPALNRMLSMAFGGDPITSI